MDSCSRETPVARCLPAAIVLIYSKYLQPAAHRKQLRDEEADGSPKPHTNLCCSQL